MKIIKILSLAVLFIVFVMCKENKTHDINDKQNLVHSKEPIQYRFDFPDTVYVNEKYNGKLLYQSDYDSITTVFTDKEKDRFVLFAMLVTNKVDYELSYLKSIVRDTIGALNNREILLRDITFPYKGVFYIDGIINDVVFVDEHRKDEQGEDLIRWLEINVRVTKKVIVVNKDASK